MTLPQLQTPFNSSARSKRESKYPPPYSIRFTWDERERLEQLAGRQTWSAVIRDRLFGDSATPRRKPPRKPSVNDEALAKALGELGQSRLAANLNQLAKAANQGALPVTPELVVELEDACHAVRAMRSDLMFALGLLSVD